ncbi:hypothetical protein N7532_001390 [Penicillium argentinense]|uniref:Uncharacterized protein n=1 Tax=Penicillium argentinense TaxID=1131581 RepID=A0A9W9G398_9EURO|nr:uncharacterized protein N7532_001390 [Penicillium argentinense]KAJ5110855.1 hypothetical protein N7532_001390 [Penicillium argentinense]
MMQLWLFAIRHFVNTPPVRRPEKSSKPFYWSTEMVSLHRLARFACRLGFRSNEIHDLSSKDQNDSLARGLLERICSDEFLELEPNKLKAISTQFGGALEDIRRHQIHVMGPGQFATNDVGQRAQRRCNRPTINQYEIQRGDLFIKQVFSGDQSPAEFVTPLGVTRDILFCFFGDNLVTEIRDWSRSTTRAQNGHSMRSANNGSTSHHRDQTQDLPPHSPLFPTASENRDTEELAQEPGTCWAEQLQISPSIYSKPSDVESTQSDDHGTPLDVGSVDPQTLVSDERASCEHPMSLSADSPVVLETSSDHGPKISDRSADNVTRSPVSLYSHPTGTPDNDIEMVSEPNPPSSVHIPLATGFETNSGEFGRMTYITHHSKIPEILKMWYNSRQDVLVIFLFEIRAFYKFPLENSYDLRSTLCSLAQEYCFMVIHDLYGLTVPDINKIYETALTHHLILAGKRDTPSQKRNSSSEISVDEFRRYVQIYDIHTGKRKREEGESKSSKRPRGRAG